MNRTTLGAFLLALLSAVLLGAPAEAQATRTWVSGVGDDANPCSRTAPCKTFAGAISKTAAGGEIDALDPGGFGAVTITKSLTIDGGAGQVASVLVSGTAGIVVSGAGIVVTLRNLGLQGIGTGTTGINILNAARVSVQNCDIQGFITSGIAFVSSAAGSKLTVTDTGIHNNTGTGISMAPAASGAFGLVALDNVRISENGTGVSVSNNVKATATRAIIANNTGAGATVSTTTALAVLDLDASSVSNNSGNGLTLSLTGGHPIVRLSNTSVWANVGNSMAIPVGGNVFSYGTNRINDNGTDTLPDGSSALH